ncbi:MAG: hypothetical protein V4610_15670 [Pseudomonadota bacterium]|jgi:hypothetical protein
MLINCSSPDDIPVEVAARGALQLNPEWVREIHSYTEQSIPRIASDEDVILIGHGNYDGNTPYWEIGDADGRETIYPTDIVNKIREILPDGLWSGSIYIDCCYSMGGSSPLGPGMELAFSEAVYNIAQTDLLGIDSPTRNDTRGQRVVPVFGRRGGVSGPTPGPESTDWKSANPSDSQPVDPSDPNNPQFNDPVDPRDPNEDPMDEGV